MSIETLILPDVPVLGALIDHVVRTSTAGQNTRYWTPEEVAFLRRYLGPLDHAQIAQVLGRSESAVKIQQVRRMIPSPSKRPGYYTGNQVARILHVDIHCIMLLHQRGLMNFDVLPGPRRILQIKRTALWVWAINPENWLYFKMDRVRDPRLRRLCQLRRERWGDEWWSSGQVARYHGLSSTTVINHAIHEGRLPAKRWGNWWIKKADALALRTWKGKGGQGVERDGWSPRADAFLVLARDAWLMQWDTIGALMHWAPKRAMWRYKTLKERAGEA